MVAAFIFAIIVVLACAVLFIGYLISKIREVTIEDIFAIWNGVAIFVIISIPFLISLTK